MICEVFVKNMKLVKQRSVSFGKKQFKYNDKNKENYCQFLFNGKIFQTLVLEKSRKKKLNENFLGFFLFLSSKNNILILFLVQ